MPKYRVMIVDDDPEVIQLIEHVLSTKYEVVKAYNGLDALEKLPRYQPDFIILDVMMPLMDGFQTCEALRKNPQYAETPIYFLTSAASKDQVKKGYALGCDLYLQKPIDPFRLLKNIDFYIEKHGLNPRPKDYDAESLSDDAKSRPQAAQKEAQIPSEPVRIMVIDDNEETLEFVTAALKRKDDGALSFEIIPTTNPVDALTKIVHYQPDIILLDIRMPRLDGFQLCKIIQINQNLKDISIQFMSASSVPKDAQIAKALTGNELIRKPFDMRFLHDSILKIAKRPDFRVREKRMSFDDVVREIQLERQREEEQRRIRREKQTRRESLKPLEEFYEEFKKKGES